MLFRSNDSSDSDLSTDSSNSHETSDSGLDICCWSGVKSGDDESERDVPLAKIRKGSRKEDKGKNPGGNGTRIVSKGKSEAKAKAKAKEKAKAKAKTKEMEKEASVNPVNDCYPTSSSIGRGLEDCSNFLGTLCIEYSFLKILKYYRDRKSVV